MALPATLPRLRRANRLIQAGRWTVNRARRYFGLAPLLPLRSAPQEHHPPREPRRLYCGDAK